jgi:glycogen(starch) synthase
MRVLLVADVIGGVRTFVDELTRGLVRRGVELHLALLGPGAPPGAAAAASCQVRELKLEWMPDAWADLRATSDWVNELTARYRPDIVHMNTFARVIDPHVPVLLTVHSCVATWWRGVHGVDAPSGWERYRRLVRAALSRAELLCTPTRALLDELGTVYGDLPPARVNPNGRALAPPRESAEERLVVCVGRLWDEAKNAALVARAAPGIDGRVILIGPGGPPGAENVENLGPLPPGEVYRWLARATVCAGPARYEPFGLAALEAALCGCALVLGDIASLREVWREAATYVPPDDADALARAVNALLDDPEHRRRAADAARAQAARYTPEATANGYLDAYSGLTSPRVAA